MDHWYNLYHLASIAIHLAEYDCPSSEDLELMHQLADHYF